MEISKEKIRIRIKDTLRLMNLEGFEGRTSHHLSFGERKRVALATVLAMQPDVIAFDEPFSNLDPATIKQFIETIKNLDATVLIVSQQILPVLACCDRIAVGSTAEIMADKALLEKCRLDISFYADILSCFIHKNCR
jgi:cobalt/nickel transport system ATP-binding protein